MVRGTDRGERGQSLAEFALSVPLLALILFALTEFGIMLNDQVAIVNASRDGARVAALQGAGDPNQTSDIQTAVSNAQQPLIGCAPDASSPGVTSGLSGGGGAQIATWTVTVSCTYTPITPLGALFGFFGGAAGSTFAISQTTTMRDTYCFRPSCHP